MEPGWQLQKCSGPERPVSMICIFSRTLLGETCLDAGIRASIGVPLIETQTAWASDIDSYFEQGPETA